MKKRCILFSPLLIAALALTGCLKKAYDKPPDLSKDDPGLPVTATIAQLKAMNGLFDYHTGGDTSIVTSDVTIAGIVTADDRSGNYYKAINIEDSTGGIQLAVDAYSLYSNYPVGRKIYVQCKGLTLGYNGGTPVLGMGVDETMTVLGIPGSQVSAHIVKADVGHAIAPKVVTMAQLAVTNAASVDRALLNCLVTIEDAAFADSAGTTTYAQPNGTINRDIKDCSGKKMAVRTSNYANFAAIPMPAGKGSITGIFSIYTSASFGTVSPQLTIRDTGDVQFYGPRCGGGTGGSTSSTAPLISIDSMRRLYMGANIKLGSYRMRGTVISDAANGNVTANNIVLQDGDRGISVYGLSGTYVPGDSLVIDVTGDSLLNYRGTLEVKVVSGSTVIKAATNAKVVPRQVPVSQIIAAYSDYEYTLVKILNGTVAAGGNYAGSKLLEDGTGTVTLYTATGATFAALPVPAGAHSWTGIVSRYNTTKQLQLRSTADVQ